jgi:hypothetical protein
MAFADILNRQAGSAERPKPLPVGTYLAMVKGQYEEITAKSGNKGLQFTLQILQAAEDVDEASLAEALNGKPLGDKTTKTTFWTSEDALWRLDKFLEDLGMELGTATYSQVLASTPGKQVMISLKHKPTQDGTSVFSEVASTAPVGE